MGTKTPRAQLARARFRSGRRRRRCRNSPCRARLGTRAARSFRPGELHVPRPPLRRGLVDAVVRCLRDGAVVDPRSAWCVRQRVERGDRQRRGRGGSRRHADPEVRRIDPAMGWKLARADPRVAAGCAVRRGRDRGRLSGGPSVRRRSAGGRQPEQRSAERARAAGRGRLHRHRRRLRVRARSAQRWGHRRLGQQPAGRLERAAIARRTAVRRGRGLRLLQQPLRRGAPQQWVDRHLGWLDRWCSCTACRRYLHRGPRRPPAHRGGAQRRRTGLLGRQLLGPVQRAAAADGRAVRAGGAGATPHGGAAQRWCRGRVRRQPAWPVQRPGLAAGPHLRGRRGGRLRGRLRRRPAQCGAAQ